ncbi:Membrane magnesium transporter 1 [Saguinus oedipus]|uniref:Membrane magnesium transporter 1 n=1 Tax=Saguinus oedipus TaxID=9490 RepID=A0ABQ9TH10_SAGOE|nr:Membrane magnesium transporter 1 [Saguinus oedipus]
MRLTEKEDESLPIDYHSEEFYPFQENNIEKQKPERPYTKVFVNSFISHWKGRKDTLVTFDTLRNHPSFYVFNHRGRVLFRPSDTANSSNQDALSSNTSLKFRKLESLRR